MTLILAVLLVGFAALYFGAEWLIRGATAIGLKARLSKSFIGLVLVALGTSAPEFTVNFLAALRDHTGLALANVAGSNLTNLCVGFGLTAMAANVALKRGMFATDLALFSLAPVLIVFLFFANPQRELPYWSLAPFAAVLALYMWSLKRRSRSSNNSSGRDVTFRGSYGVFLLGAAVLYLGGEMVLRAALGIARTFDLSETLIGLTIVAAGTSIPDVAASVIAAKKGEHEMAVGNLLGSNISNVFVVLGGTLLAAGHSLPVDGPTIMDFIVLSVLSSAFLVVVIVKQRVPRITGAAFLVFYIFYMLYRTQGELFI